MPKEASETTLSTGARVRPGRNRSPAMKNATAMGVIRDAKYVDSSRCPTLKDRKSEITDNVVYAEKKTKTDPFLKMSELVHERRSPPVITNSTKLSPRG